MNRTNDDTTWTTWTAWTTWTWTNDGAILDAIHTNSLTNAANDLRVAQWHVPYPYELVLRAHYQCSICYGGCGGPYSEGDSLVIRHIDKRILGKDNTGKLFYNDNFKPTYYRSTTVLLQRNCSISENISRPRSRRNDELSEGSVYD